MLKLTDPVDKLSGVGPTTVKKLAKLDIDTVSDLIHHYPSRHIDYSHPNTINQLQAKKPANFSATLEIPTQFVSKTGKPITQVEAHDTTGSISLIWFYSRYISKLIRPGQTYTIAGTPNWWGNKLALISPQIEIFQSGSLHIQGLVPVYPQTQGLTSKWLRTKIKLALSQTSLRDTLTNLRLDPPQLPPLKTALKNIHFPPSKLDLNEADKRLSFNQHLNINLRNLRQIQKLGASPKIKIKTDLDDRLKESLPFKLTPDQQKTIISIYTDLKSANPSHRLIQGDTGSGKTILAIFAATQILANNYSICLMAPTQILANQHFQTFRKFLPQQSKSIQLVTGSSPLKENISLPTIFIGTHALLNQIPNSLKYPLAAVFIDEQHKFGVKQREKLNQRSPYPHLFNLSATPIPRTLALGLFGEIKTSSIKYKPHSRLPVKTWIVDNEHLQKKGIPWLKNQLKKENKIFVVCPLIHSSKKIDSIKSVDLLHKHYQKLFPQTLVLLIHGRLKEDQKNTVINQFSQAESAILISTPVIEVGIDIPEANIIVIHSAERFGLAQLHQLRGRVGRGKKQSFCFLVPSSQDQQESERLNLLTQHHSGLNLAKLDLKLRGAGKVFGLIQHGRFPTRLKHFWNRSLYQQAKSFAHKIIQQYPKQASTIADQLTN